MKFNDLNDRRDIGDNNILIGLDDLQYNNLDRKQMVVITIY